jgi:hypothetical protein
MSYSVETCIHEDVQDVCERGLATVRTSLHVLVHCVVNARCPGCSGRRRADICPGVVPAARVRARSSAQSWPVCSAVAAVSMSSGTDAAGSRRWKVLAGSPDSFNARRCGMYESGRPDQCALRAPRSAWRRITTYRRLPGARYSMTTHGFGFSDEVVSCRPLSRVCRRLRVGASSPRRMVPRGISGTDVERGISRQCCCPRALPAAVGITP